MKKEFTAKTVEEAKALAVQEFGVAEEKITFTVVEEPKKGLLFTKGEAKIEAEYEQTKEEAAAEYMIAVLKAMGFEDAAIDISPIENGALLDIKAEGFEELLGKKGELLDSLQYLASLVSNKINRDYFRITTDCGGFRAKRKAQLEELAGKIAATVKRTGRTSALEPMNPYERRIIHAAVSEIEGVTSRSTGEEPYRKVIISSTEKRSSDRRGGYGNDRRGGRGGRRNDRKPRAHFDITTSFEKDYKKPKPEDTMTSAGLYSKIEF